MQIHDRTAFLERVNFLEGAPRELLERIAQDLEPIEKAEGEVIFADEEVGDAMYFIVEGEVRIVKKRQDLLTRHKGEYVGEMALVDDAPRSAAAVAATDALLLRWDKDSFQEVLAANGRVAYQVCRAFSAKIRESVQSVSVFKQDLERAIQVQSAMLPDDTFRNAVLSLAARCIQADAIGGDYFDYLPIDDDQIALVMADAQGHGFPAALLVAMIKTRLHSRAARNHDPGTVMAALNQTLTEQINDVQMVTGIYVLLDAARRELRFCNAGHIAQYHYRAGEDELEVLASESPILGHPNPADDGFETTIRPWSPGDLLVLCTDGLTEAENGDEEEYGAERLAESLLRHKHREPEEIRQRLLEDLESFRGKGPYKDDVTLLVARLC